MPVDFRALALVSILLPACAMCAENPLTEGSGQSASPIALEDTPTTNPGTGVKTIEFGAEKYQARFDTTETPELTEWVETELMPAVREWYPKIVAMLPSEGFEAPRSFSITFRKDKPGVADTAGTRINCAADWFKKNLKGEGKGAVIHELVHVVQQYGKAHHPHTDATHPPGWLVEGIPDYIRWYKYEPQSHGADLRRGALTRARFDGSYRVSANFINYVTETYDNSLVEKVNAAIRDGKYNADLWKTLTGKSLDELNDEWKLNLEKKFSGDGAGEKK